MSLADRVYQGAPSWVQSVLLNGYAFSLHRKRFGADFVYVLNPATLDADLPKGTGPDYMSMWAAVIEGADGLGEFDFEIAWHTLNAARHAYVCPARNPLRIANRKAVLPGAAAARAGRDDDTCIVAFLEYERHQVSSA